MQDLKTIRLSKSMSQKRLAFEAGVDVRTIRRMESGVPVSPESHRAVMVALGMDPAKPNAIVPPDAAALFVTFSRVVGHVRAASLELRARVLFAAFVVLCLGAAVSDCVWQLYYKPNVRIDVSFEKACDSDQWNRAFRVMDRLFPDGYDIAERVDGLDSCAYAFKVRKDFTDWRSEEFEMLQTFKSAGVRATMSAISPPSHRTAISEAAWNHAMDHEHPNRDILGPKTAITEQATH